MIFNVKICGELRRSGDLGLLLSKEFVITSISIKKVIWP